MNCSSLITQIYFAQCDVLKTYKDSKDVKKTFEHFGLTEKKFLGAIKDNAALRELYDELDEAQSQYLSSTERNAFNHGFKTGMRIALEALADNFTGDID